MFCLWLEICRLKDLLRDTYDNLSQSEQEAEITFLKETKAQKDALQSATIQSWQPKN